MNKACVKKIRFYNFIKFSLIFAAICFCPAVFAQRTIINIPSSDVIPAGDILLKNSNRFGSFSTGTESSITPAFTLGIGRGMELSTNVATYLDSARDVTVKNNFSAKKVWFLGASTRLTVGSTISPYYTQSVHPDTFVYAHVAQRIKRTKTSLTAGGYMHGRRHFLNTGGIVLGIEQVIIPNKLRVAADWLSGDNSFGKFGFGLKYRPHPTVSVTTSVIIPNEDTKNLALNLSVSKFVSLDEENPLKRRLRNVD